MPSYLPPTMHPSGKPTIAVTPPASLFITISLHRHFFNGLCLFVVNEDEMHFGLILPVMLFVLTQFELITL